MSHEPNPTIAGEKATVPVDRRDFLCTVGAATAVLTLASGWLYAAFAGASFLLMALLCLTAIPLTAGLTKEPSLTP